MICVGNFAGVNLSIDTYSYSVGLGKFCLCRYKVYTRLKNIENVTRDRDSRSTKAGKQGRDDCSIHLHLTYLFTLTMTVVWFKSLSIDILVKEYIISAVSSLVNRAQ